ncbi:MAG: haloacid dehalogenase-like hydrolase [Polyangiaceae bacterium]|nr:haloacid dehalogenase-like hydrolase [Polyangiaceae bacterium]
MTASLHTAVSRAEQVRLLAAVLERVEGARGACASAVVFDLDGTLVDNRPRTCAIMRELAERWQAERPDAASALGALCPDQLDYLLEDVLARLALADAWVTEALEFWRGRFFFDHHLRHDRALAGALEFARACHAAGATIVYFSGRDLPNMALGTLASLRDLGFPIGVPGTELVLKPHFETSDSEFKRQVTPQLRRCGVLVAAFDNEPGNCNIFKEAFPSCDVFLLDTQHHPSAPPLARDINVISDFVL